MGSQSWTGLSDFYFHKNFRIVCTVSFKNAIGIFIKIALMALEFSVYNIMSSASSDSFASFFSIWISFFCFFFLPDCFGKTSKTRLNRIGENGHACLFPDLRKKAFSFSALRMILGMGLSYRPLSP